MKYKFENGKLIINKEEFKVSNYSFTEELWNGANGVVIKAVDNITKRVVAIKVWLPRKKFIYQQPCSPKPKPRQATLFWRGSSLTAAATGTMIHREDHQCPGSW